MVTGLFEGYNTMDAIAGLAFSIVIVGSLRSKGFKTKKSLVNGTITAAQFTALKTVAATADADKGLRTAVAAALGKASLKPAQRLELAKALAIAAVTGD